MPYSFKQLSFTGRKTWGNVVLEERSDQRRGKENTATSLVHGEKDSRKGPAFEAII